MPKVNAEDQTSYCKGCSIRRILVIAVLAIAVLPFARSEMAVTQADSIRRDEEELRELERAWNAALMRRDKAALDRIVADDYVATGTDGEVRNKAQDLANLENGEYTLR